MRTHSIRVVSRILLCTAVILALLLNNAARANQIRLVGLNYPPYISVDDGKVGGMAVDIVTEAFHRAGRDIAIEVMPWARALDEAKSGSADAIFPAAKNAEREGFLDYSTGVLVQQAVSLFVRKDSQTAFDGDLTVFKNTKVGVVNQMSYGSKIDAAIKSGTLENLDRSNDSENNVQKLVAGRFEVMPSNRYVALSVAKKAGLSQQIKELLPEVESILTYIAFTKARDVTKLRDEFDNALTTMKADGSYDKILQRYAR